MKKLILLIGLLYFIPFCSVSQFIDKKKANTNNNNSQTNDNNGGQNNAGNNDNNPKNKSGTKTGENMTAVFDDGSKIDYVLITKAASDENRITVDLPIFGILREWDWSFLALSYYNPGKFFIKGYADLIAVGNMGMGGSADILYFLTTTEKPKKTKLELTQSGYVVKMVRQEIPKEVSFGIHAGFAYEGLTPKNQTTDDEGNLNYFNGSELAIGLGLFKARHCEWFVPSDNSRKIRKGTINTGLYLDMIYIPSSLAAQHLGARFYVDGKISFLVQHEWGLYYQFGIVADGNAQPAMIGFGPYITF